VIKEVLNHCGHTPFTLVRNRAIILVFLDTGLRLTALSNIMLKDIDFETGLITVREKGDKPNMVHIGQSTVSSIQKYLSIREQISNEYLWVNQNGKRTQKSAIQIMIRRLRKYDGDYRWTPHTFRNTW
jgi:site-specific recombinase XerC